MKFCHVTISVKNAEESLKFYRDVIGLPLKRRFSAGPGVEIIFLGDGETEIELIYDQAHTDLSIGYDISLGFEVESIQETIYLLRQNGIATGDVIQPNPQMKFIFATDPNGLKVQFVEYIK